jgi:hypothetical protein
MASSDKAIEKDALHDWVEEETRALDVVASWETLCDVYRTLEFSDPLSDAMRLEEFKWIIAEMNKHLTRARNKLMKCRDPESMIEELNGMFTSTGATVSNRMDLTYHKMRQIWIKMMIGSLKARTPTVEEETENGRRDFWNE